LGCTLVVLAIVGTAYTRLVFGTADALRNLVHSGEAALAPMTDPQAALAMLPVYQIGLFVALWVAAFAGLGWRRFAIGVGILAISGVVLLVARGEFSTHAGLEPDVRDVRAWAVAAPVLVALLLERLRAFPATSWGAAVG
jgi:hypothetical protein